MLQCIRERAALCLIVLLPLHALLVTVLTKVIVGPGHSPLPVLALWKEGVIGILLVIAILEIIITVELQRRFWALKLLSFWKKPTRLRLDWIDGVIVIALVYGVIETFAVGALAAAFALGIKYDFIPLIAFLILRRVPWSEWFRTTAAQVVIVMGVILALYGFATLVLPMSFFTALGYSDLHSLYIADKPLAAFQQIGGAVIRRMQSTMSGPNQLGAWMLIPLGVMLANIGVKSEKLKVKNGLLVILFLLIILLTFSRAAWIGAFVMIVWALCTQMNRRLLLPIVTLGFCFLLCVGTVSFALFPDVLFRTASSSDHIKKPLEALQIMLEHPFGTGLGSAGPASNAVTDTCVMLDAGADVSWAKDQSDLCVFVAGEQVQPTNDICSCPVLTENWYLQWGVEMGWVGLIASLMLLFLVLRKKSEVRSQKSVMLAFLGVSIAGLFLHSFEDAAVAYTIWILIAAYDQPE